MRQKQIKAGLLVMLFTFSCSVSNSNQGKSNFVEGKGYCVYKYGDSGCDCSYQYGEGSWICLSGPTTACEGNKSKAGQCIKYVPDLDEWARQQEKAYDTDPGQPASISND